MVAVADLEERLKKVGKTSTEQIGENTVVVLTPRKPFYPSPNSEDLLAKINKLTQKVKAVLPQPTKKIESFLKTDQGLFLKPGFFRYENTVVVVYPDDKAWEFHDSRPYFNFDFNPKQWAHSLVVKEDQTLSIKNGGRNDTVTVTSPENDRDFFAETNRGRSLVTAQQAAAIQTNTLHYFHRIPTRTMAIYVRDQEGWSIVVDEGTDAQHAFFDNIDRYSIMPGTQQPSNPWYRVTLPEYNPAVRSALRRGRRISHTAGLEVSEMPLETRKKTLFGRKPLGRALFGDIADVFSQAGSYMVSKKGRFIVPGKTTLERHIAPGHVGIAMVAIATTGEGKIEVDCRDGFDEGTRIKQFESTRYRRFRPYKE